MTLVEGLTIAGLVVGPVLSIVISLAFDEFRQARLRRVNTLRQILTSRINVADPAFQVAMNPVPVDFRHNSEIMAAYEQWWSKVSVQINDTTPEHIRLHIVAENSNAQNELIRQILLSEGYSHHQAGFIMRSPYMSQSYTDQVNLTRSVLRSVNILADNTGRMANANEELLKITKRVATATEANE